MTVWPNVGGNLPDALIEISGVRLEWAAWGPPPADAPTILLLHEGLGCVRLWRDFPARLAEVTGAGVFAYSRHGYGASEPVAPPLADTHPSTGPITRPSTRPITRPITRMADEARDVLPLLIDQIAPQRLLIIGHSDGGTIAAHYLAGPTHPALRGAVLMAPHFFCEPSNVAAIERTVAAYETGDLRARLARYHADVDGAFDSWARTWLDPAFANWDMRCDITRWRHSVLFLQGRDDPYGSDGQAEAARLSPMARVAWLEACAHSPHLDRPADTLDLIGRFYREAVSDG